MFSLGGSLSERYDIERSRFNAYMWATTSTGWMIGPALSFLVADQIRTEAVFVIALGISMTWLGLCWWTLPRDITAEPKASSGGSAGTATASIGLWLAATLVFCLSSAHSLTVSSLPLFYVREVGLPGYASGVASSIKTFVEVVAIFTTPMIIARFGLRNGLLVTTLLAVVTIQLLASVQSFARDRPARATAIYWNTLMVSGLLAGPAVGFVAQAYDFQIVVRIASGFAACTVLVLISSRRYTAGKG